MLYLGIDQHARQLTISLRDESGDVFQARQVSTQPEKIQAFFAKLTRERLLMVNHLLQSWKSAASMTIRLLRDYRCHKVILIQLEEPKKRKTDQPCRGGIRRCNAWLRISLQVLWLHPPIRPIATTFPAPRLRPVAVWRSRRAR